MKNFGKKALSMSAVALLSVVAVVSPASAAAGWQLIGEDYVGFTTTNWNSNVSYGKIVTAKDGGNVGVRVYDHPVVAYAGGTIPIMEISLFEDDGASGDDLIGIVNYQPLKSGEVTYTFDVSKYADGANGKAEVYVRYRTNYKVSTVTKVLD